MVNVSCIRFFLRGSGAAHEAFRQLRCHRLQDAHHTFQLIGMVCRFSVSAAGTAAFRFLQQLTEALDQYVIAVQADTELADRPHLMAVQGPFQSRDQLLVQLAA